MTVRHETRYRQAVARNLANLPKYLKGYFKDGEPIDFDLAKRKIGIRKEDISHDNAVKAAFMGN